MRGRIARKIEKRLGVEIDFRNGRRDRPPRRLAKYNRTTFNRVAAKLDMTLRWGRDISPENMARLRAGRQLLLTDRRGRPYSIILMDYFGTIREMLVQR